MIEQKENDWVLNLMGNDNFSTADFAAVGLNAQNTSLLDEDTYKRSDQIINNSRFQDDQGNFDNAKFHKFYENAQLSYNLLANTSYLELQRLDQTKFGKDNLFAPLEQRRKFNETVMATRVPNPDRTTTGLIRIGETTNPKYSSAELALTLKVLDNPTEVYDENGIPDWSKAIWHDAPNDSWFEDFTDTRVLAQWESDGEHQDPITGQIVAHKKGQLKLNENGTYFYENLDGRDIYGRQVLNKMNTLTTDGSKWNKYDFFDSDDLELKSIGKTLLKNMVLVGSMFIPYVGPWVAGASVASQLVGLTGTLGKMALGSDSPTLSALEGWSKSVNRLTAKSAYAQLNTWCWENFISLIGDVAGLLKELRVLFEFAPALIKGNSTLGWNGIDESKQLALAAKRTKYYDELYATKLNKLQEAKKAAKQALTKEELDSYSLAKASTKLMGNKDVETFMNSYNHIGEILSKGYMTAITVGDTYGEAKYEGGASDLEATLLTLGYAYGELKVLNTELGNWILPELKASGLKNKAIIKALTEVPEEMRLTSQNILNATKEAKKASVKYWLLKGKETAEKVASKGKGLAGQVISGGLGEGFEETAEELLADFSKSCFNVLQWLLGDEGRMSAWDNMRDRYLMSFVGGAVGGGLTAAGTNFKVDHKPMTSELASQELIYMLRQGKKDELYKSLNKMTLANPYLQSEIETLSDGTVVFKQANKSTGNMDSDIKKAFVNQVELLDRIIKADGLNVTDDAFIDRQTFKDVRLGVLQNSPISALYLLNFNKLCLDIIETRLKLIQYQTPKSDSDKELDSATQTAINQTTIHLNELIKEKNAYLEGEYAMDYTSTALFDLTPMMARYYTTPFFKDYAENKYKRSFEKLTEDEIKEAKEEFKNWKETEYKDHIATLAPMYLTMARNSGIFILEFAANYDALRKNSTILLLLNYKSKTNYNTSAVIDPVTNLVDESIEDEWASELIQSFKEEPTKIVMSLISSNGTLKIRNLLKVYDDAFKALDKEDPEYQTKLAQLQADYNTALNLEFFLNIDTYLKDFILAGIINPDIKSSLLNVTQSVSDWTQFILDKVINYLPPHRDTLLKNLGYDETDLSITLLEICEELEEDKENKGEITEDDIYRVKVLMQVTGFKPVSNDLITVKHMNDAVDKFNQLKTHFDKTVRSLKKVPYTDIITFILNFISNNSDTQLNISKLIETVNDIITLNVNNSENMNFDGVIDLINEGIEVIGWLLGLVIGAEYDANVSLDNLVGYNVTLNEIARKNHVKDWIDLPTISKEDVGIINLDLELIKSKLVDAKNIYYINLGKKLNLLSKAAINSKFIIYNRLKKFIVSIGDEWKNKDKLELALENASILKQYAESRDLSQLTEDNKESLVKESVDIDHAVFEFFLDNADIIKKGDLYTLFTRNNFNLYEDAELYIDENTEFFEDRNFLYWLASRAAIDRYLFNNEFRQIIDPEAEHVLAPISTQEEAVYLNIAELLNGDVTTAFMLAFRLAVIKDFNASDDNRKLELATKYFNIKDNNRLKEYIENNEIVNEDILPIYTNIYLTEGRPGTGKSEAVDVYTVMLLKLFHPELVSNAWVIHDNKSKAELLGKHLTLETFLAMDKNTVMTTIYNKYKTNRDTNEHGEVLYDRNEWITDTDSRVIIKANPDEMTEDKIPSIIIIDEVSHFDQGDLMLLDKFARKYGITIITSGDFKQCSIFATTLNADASKKELELTLTPMRSHFKHSPRLGISMRTVNVQMDKTLTAFQNWESKQNVSEAILFYYYEDDKIGLNGVKFIRGKDLAEQRATIERMIRTLDTSTDKNAKIGLVYHKADSALVKLIDEYYSDKFEKFEGTAAQGLEGQYYIVDMEGCSEDVEVNTKILYTGFTRAKLGAVVVNHPAHVQIDNNREETTTKSTFSEKGLRNYAQKTKDTLDKINKVDETIKYLPRSKIDVSVVAKTEKDPEYVEEVSTTGLAIDSSKLKEEPNSNEDSENKETWENKDNIINITFENKHYLSDGKHVGLITDDKTNTFKFIDISSNEAKKVLEIFNALQKEPTEIITPQEDNDKKTIERVLDDNKPNESVEIIETDKNDSELKSFTYLFHSHNTFELGVPFNESDEDPITFYGTDINRYKYRIDNVIGLLKIFESDWTKPTKPLSFYINILGELRALLFNIEDKNNLQINISNLFEKYQIPKVKSLEFGLISSPRINTKNNDSGWGNKNNVGVFGVFDRHLDEQTIGNDNPEEKSHFINRKAINAVIKLENGKRLTIPLFVLGNLETYTHGDNFISKLLAKLYKKSTKDDKTVDIYLFHTSIISDPLLGNIPEIVNIAKLFLFTGGGYFKIEDTLWTPAKGLFNRGILVNVDSHSGKYLPYNGKNTFTPITKALKAPKMRFTKQIYTSLDKISDEDSVYYELARRGHAYILATNHPDLKTDKLIQEAYCLQILHPELPKKVTRIYVLPPYVSIDLYLTNLHSLLYETSQSKRKDIKKLGSHLTSYYIWKRILPSLKTLPELFGIAKADRELLILFIEKLSEIENNSSPETRVDNLLGEILASVTWGTNKKGVTKSLQEHLNYYLTQLYTDVHDNIVTDRLSEITKLINNTGLDKIYYSVKFKERIPGKDQTFVALMSDQGLLDESTYTLNGLPFSINAKLDSNLFSCDKSFNNIIESFLSKIQTHTDEKRKITVVQSSDSFAFAHDIDKHHDKDDKGMKKVFKFDKEYLGYSQLEYEVTDDGNYIVDGKELVNNSKPKGPIKLFQRTEVEKLIKTTIGTALDSLIIEEILENVYSDYIKYLLGGQYINPDNLLKIALKKKVTNLNKIADNNLYIYNKNLVYHMILPLKTLEAVNLDSISIDDNFSKIIPEPGNIINIPLGAGVLQCNLNKGEGILTVTGSANALGQESVAELVDILLKYLLLGTGVELINNDGEPSLLSDYKNNRRITRNIAKVLNKENISSEDKTYVLLIISYLESDQKSDDCTTTIKIKIK